LEFLKIRYQRHETWVTRDQCFDFLNIFAKKFSEKIGVFVSKQSQILKKKLIKTLVFEKTPIFSPKIVETLRKL
jgi:hypothetical protein